MPEVCANTALNPAHPTLEMGLSSVGAIKERQARHLIKECNYPGIYDC